MNTGFIRFANYQTTFYIRLRLVLAMESINPATGQVIKEYQQHSEDEIYKAIDRASETFETWQERPLRVRETLLQSASDILNENKQKYAELIVQEVGKPITQARAEVEKCAWVCEHYAEYANAYLSPDYHPSPPGTKAKTVYEPLGIVLAIMPWNYPFWQVFRFAAPYLTAGNVGLLKHASNVPGCALAIEEVFRKAGYPEGAFQSLLIPSELVDDALNDDRVQAVTITGGSSAGRSIAATAGEELKKSVLELGGSDPFVVLDDAALDTAAETGAWARNQNGGQSCIAAKRFIISDEVYDGFVRKLISEIDNLVIGDPAKDSTDIGPQASQRLMNELHEQVQEIVGAGATVELGGEPLDRNGAYYPPTVLTDVPPECNAASQEIFGPIATVYRVKSETEAVELANNTAYGLGASVWTKDRERGEQIARQIESGCVYINQMVKSDPRVPFGGIKESGYGRELSEVGMKEFVNKKTIWTE